MACAFEAGGTDDGTCESPLEDAADPLVGLNAVANLSAMGKGTCSFGRRSSSLELSLMSGFELFPDILKNILVLDLFVPPSVS